MGRRLLKVRKFKKVCGLCTHHSRHLQVAEAEPERTGLRGMIEALLQQLADRITGSAKGETARQLYLDINISGLKDENDEGKAAAFDAHKDAILPVLIKGEPGQLQQYSSAVVSPPPGCMPQASVPSHWGRLSINDGTSLRYFILFALRLLLLRRGCIIFVRTWYVRRES